MEPRRVGLHDFHFILRDPVVTTPTHALFHTNKAFPALFIDATESLSPPSWRLLRCGPPARWANLCDASFDARRELIDFAAIAAQQQIPPDYLGGIAPGDIADQVRWDLVECDPDVAKATWLLLGFVQFVQLDPASRVEWWQHRVWSELLKAA